MKILVAGRGFIGRKIVQELRESHEVKTLDRKPDATFQQDVTENFTIDEKFDVMIHTVGLAPGMHSPADYENIHITGTRNLLEAVDAEKTVYLSALGAGRGDHSFFKTKREGEKLVADTGKFTVLRPSTVYGEGNKLLEMIGKAAPTRVFPDIKVETQPVHVDDLVEIVERSLESFDGQVLELGGPEEMTVGEMACRIYRNRGFSCFLMPFPRFIQKTGLKALSPLPGPFNSENIKLLDLQNTTQVNDAEKILGELKPVLQNKTVKTP